MQKTVLSILLFLVLTSVVKGQECECTRVPFTPNPPCFTRCTTKLLATATKEELQLIVGLKEDVASRIVEWKGRSDADSLPDYGEVLSQPEVKEFEEKIDSLNEGQWTYFQMPVSDRGKIRKEMQVLFRKNSRSNKQ